MLFDIQGPDPLARTTDPIIGNNLFPITKGQQRRDNFNFPAGSRIRIRMNPHYMGKLDPDRIRVKSQIRIHIKVKNSGAVEHHNGGVEALYKALEGL